MSNRGIGQLKYKNLEINANIKSKVEMEKSSIDQEKNIIIIIITVIITVTDCTGRSILYIIYMPLSPPAPQAPFPRPHPNHPGTCHTII